MILSRYTEIISRNITDIFVGRGYIRAASQQGAISSEQLMVATLRIIILYRIAGIALFPASRFLLSVFELKCFLIIFFRFLLFSGAFPEKAVLQRVFRAGGNTFPAPDALKMIRGHRRVNIHIARSVTRLA